MQIRPLLIAVMLLPGLPLATTAASDNNSSPEINVAVASNFAACFNSLVDDFTKQTGVKVVASPGSTGRHFAQIKAGAPYHVFLSADALRPKLLEDSGLAVPGSRVTYAQGRLVFWFPKFQDSPAGSFASLGLSQLLTHHDIKHLAVANPRLAPYGKAAQQVLSHLELTSKLAQSLVTGQNISQTWQFVASGNAEAGLVALSQVIDSNPGKWLLIPDTLHEPIIQQAVLLKAPQTEKQGEAAERLLQYLQSPAALKIMAAFGYENHGKIKQ